MSAVSSLKWRQISDVIPTVTEINFVDGVTSAIQSQLNSKVDTADLVDPWPLIGDSIYFKNEINSLLNTKANVNTGVKYVAPVGATAIGIGFAASDAFVADAVYAAKFYLPYNLTINDFVFHITTGASGGTISWAIYNEAKTSKLVAAESIDATNTGVITQAVTHITLTPGWYWESYSNSVNTIRVMALYAYGSTAFDADTLVQGIATNVAVSGVMPATLGTISTNYLKVPIVSLNN